MTQAHSVIRLAIRDVTEVGAVWLDEDIRDGLALLVAIKRPPAALGQVKMGLSNGTVAGAAEGRGLAAGVDRARTERMP